MLGPCCSILLPTTAPAPRQVGGKLALLYPCLLSQNSHCSAHSPTQTQGSHRDQHFFRSIWRKACKRFPAYLRKAATAFTASTTTSSTGQSTVFIRTSMASRHMPRFVNNVISTGCLRRGNRISKNNIVRVSNSIILPLSDQMDSWAVWFQPCFSVFRASCSQGCSLKFEQVEGLLQRVNFSRSGAPLWWKKPRSLDNSVSVPANSDMKSTWKTGSAKHRDLST